MYEVDEGYVLNLSGASNASIAGAQGTGTITNDDATPTVTLTTDKTSISENGETATVTATLSNKSYQAVTIELGFTGTAVSGTDYNASVTILVIPSGSTSGTITLTGIDNAVYASGKSVGVEISNVTNGTESGTQQVTISITDDESQPSVTLSVSPTTLSENGGTATITATLSKVFSEDVTVALDYTGTANSGTDYTGAASMVISAGNLSNSITVTAQDDSTYECDETVIVDISSVTNGIESGTQQVTASITDDEIAPPSSPALTATAGDAQVSLVWNNVPYAIGYKVYMGTATGSYGGAPIATVTDIAYTDIAYTVSGLNNATTYYFTVKSINASGDSGYSNEVSATPQSSSSGSSHHHSSGSSGSTTTATTTSTTTVMVNGQMQNAGTTATSTVGGKTTTTVTVNDQKIEEKLNEEGNGATVTIPINNSSDVVVGVLNGQTVKNMEEKEAVLEIKTENVRYTLLASEINVDSVSNQIGQQVQLKDIKISVKIAESSADTVKLVEDSANKSNYQIVVKPVDFEITCTSGEKTVAVSKFNGYVERTIAIPDGVDPSKVTTGIVLNNDGTFSHVPTSIVVIDGKYYAKINSLTNSTYSVIYSPKTFDDVENHWAKEAINDMGSRLVISGIDDENYAPNKDITRGEFASIIVKGLGLMRTGTGETIYSDVNKTDWYYDAVYIANEYGLINGIGNGKFDPSRKITREEAMTIMAHAMTLAEVDTEISEEEIAKLFEGYKDSNEVNSWAEKAIAACIKNEIIQGSNGTIKPEDEITRAEVAVIVRNFLQKSKLI